MKWKLVPVEPTPEMIDTGYFVIATSHTGANAAKKAYSAMLEEDPQPPKLSDERILELAARTEAQWNAVTDQYNQWGQLGFDEIVILLSRAIEREILGGGE